MLTQDIGLSAYATHNAGMGGRIRSTFDDFIVEEKLHENTIKMIQDRVDSEHQYPVFMLKKRGIDTFNALTRVEKTLKCRLHYLGLKDAKAVTVQYISPIKKITQTPNRLQIDSQVLIELYGYSSRPLSRIDLMGNHFSINITDITSDWCLISKTMDEISKCLGDRKLPNFYGYQRFGSTRPISHLVGKEIIKQKYSEAVRLLLTYPSQQDEPETQEIKTMNEDPVNYFNLFKKMGRIDGIENQVLRVLISKPENYTRALRAIPLGLRRLFIHAYQSYLFNRTLSLALDEEVDFSSVDIGEVFGLIDSRNGRIVKIERANSKPKEGNQLTPVPLLPLVGYAYRSRGSRFDNLVNRVCKEEEVSPKDFYAKEMPELSVEGTFRSAPMLSSGFGWNFRKDVEGTVLNIETLLYRGSYVTILLREIMKCTNPVASGY